MASERNKERQKNISKYRRSHALVCARCSRTHNIHIHHIIPVVYGGTDDDNNLIPLCQSCHDELHLCDFKNMDHQMWLSMFLETIPVPFMYILTRDNPSIMNDCGYDNIKNMYIGLRDFAIECAKSDYEDGININSNDYFLFNEVPQITNDNNDEVQHEQVDS